MGFHKTLRGADLHSPSNELVENNTGSTISALKGVTFLSLGTTYPAITVANGNVDLIRGITQADIPNGGTGFITCLGFLNNVNTSSWTAGTKLYVNTVGNLTPTIFGLPVGVVLKQHASTGVIYVENTGITKLDLDASEFPDALSLELQFYITNPSFYTEVTYDLSNRVIATDIWNNSSKTLHIFNKVFTYTGNKVTTVLITRVIDGQTLQKNIVYTGNFVQNITRIYTP